MLLLGISCVLLSAVTAQTYVERTTTHGVLRGHTVQISPWDQQERHLDVFIGVPYAAPPVGDLRWRYTEPPAPWTGVKEASTFGPCCPQTLNNIRNWSLGPNYNNTGEDCLYLNLYAPRNLGESPSPSRAVMVFVHGGAYRFGSGEEYPGHQLAQEGDVVVVTINYRLGVLAFLSTEDAVAPGNYGLMDVVFALRWVKDNIGAFGGDKDTVTLFGQSAGGAAVSTMIFSPEATGLFHRVIPQSGHALSPWAVYRPPARTRPHAEQLADAHDCPTEDSQAMVDCLRQVAPLDLVTTPIVGTYPGNAAWAPNVDGTVLTDLPETLLEQGDFAQVALLSGTVPDEVSDEYPGVPDIENGWPREEKLSRMYSRSRRYGDSADLVFSAFQHEYDLPGDVWTEQRDLYLELRSDDEYMAPHAKHAQGHAKDVPDTYMYTFEHLSQNNQHPDWMGVPHFEEIYYIFGTPLWDDDGVIPCPWGCTNVVWYNHVQWTQEDKNLSRDMIEMWTSFAKTGRPSLGAADWPRYDDTSQHYGLIQNGTVRLSGLQFYKYRRMSFYNSLVPELRSPRDCPVSGAPTRHAAPWWGVVTLLLTTTKKFLNSNTFSLPF